MTAYVWMEGTIAFAIVREAGKVIATYSGWFEIAPAIEHVVKSHRLNCISICRKEREIRKMSREWKKIHP